MAAIRKLFDEQGSDQYFGERVTQREHALQAARLAVGQRATDALVAAALLHDVGHLILAREPMPEGARHEEAASAFLSQYFDDNVVEPVRLHVEAKRYLCAIDPQYAAQLSEASTESLARQGGPMSTVEAEAFASLRYAQDAIALRQWDDEAKVPGRDVPPLDAYVRYIERALKRTAEPWPSV